MCGIYCAVSERCILPTSQHSCLLRRRGPDSTEIQSWRISARQVVLFSSVLSMRGSPNEREDSRKGSSPLSSFCWNGEAWLVRDEAVCGYDTTIVHNLLNEAIVAVPKDVRSRKEDLNNRAVAISICLSQIAGPYSFILLDKFNKVLFFGRDYLGRRSLLATTTHTNDLIMSSVADDDPQKSWTEIEADGIYYVDLETTDQRLIFERVSYSYTDTDVNSVIPRLSLNRSIPTSTAGLNQDSRSVLELEGLLMRAVSLRISQMPSHSTPGHSSPARLAVLFSGGLDCSVISRIADIVLPVCEPIDLLNVAFENPRIHKSDSASSKNWSSCSVYETCPDRMTGRASHAELSKICPDRDWRFVAINIPYSETLSHKQRIISLMQPHKTEMDLSICLALYFAARGVGTLDSDKDSAPYETPARVLLSGLGADELFAGYSRHAVAFRGKGFAGLLQELSLEIERLGKRNLGRDDRVISHWGREARFPYLDESVVGWALSAPIDHKCSFGDHEPGKNSNEPGKRVLRCLAQRLGLSMVAKEKKRAIQFGSRSAKMETGRTKGTQPLQ